MSCSKMTVFLSCKLFHKQMAIVEIKVAAMLLVLATAVLCASMAAARRIGFLTLLVLEIRVILAWAALRTEVANINAKRVQMAQRGFQISAMQAVDQVDNES